MIMVGDQLDRMDPRQTQVSFLVGQRLLPRHEETMREKRRQASEARKGERVEADEQLSLWDDDL